MLKKFVIVLVLIALGLGAWKFFSGGSEEAFELEEGYAFLYNGKNLEGWRVIGGQSTFSAEGEAILGRNGPGENTFLRTEKTFGDFSLKMQMRWDEFGNSGVLFRSNQRGGDGRAYGYQFELDPSERAWSGGIYDEARRGWLANLEDNEDARAAVRLNDWNDIEIEARGAVLKTWINGVQAADIIDGLDEKGFIALQVHSGDVGVMRWRRIRLKELPGMSGEGKSLLEAPEWRNENLEVLAFNDGVLSAAFPQGEFWLSPRRQFNDAMIRMTVPACDAPTTIRLRYATDDNATSVSFAEVLIFEDRAQARLVTSAGEQVMDPVDLSQSSQHQFTGLTLGDYIALTIDETDVLRLPASGLSDRGQLRIQPARCGDEFAVEGLTWFSLKETSDVPLFYQTLDNEPAPVLTPDEALAAFRVAPGFEVELVAAEPLVEDPVAMAWDEWGRLYVVEMRGYMRDAYGTGSEEPVGQVVRLEDTNGDGLMDVSEVFLGALVNPRAVAVVNEGVLIGEPPHLWLCELPEKESLCTEKRSVGGYATDVGAANVEHMENGLRQGLDNWLYNAKSTRSLRLHKGELLEREGLFRGQWGITRDDYGRLLYNHNSTWIQADLFAAEDLVLPGSRVHPEGLGVNLTNPAEVYSIRVNPGVNRAYLDNTLREDGRLNKATGVSGLVAYRGDQFPGGYASDVFVPEVAGNVVAQFSLSGEGMNLQASQNLYDDEQWGKRDFLGSTDERFRPVDGMNGPDGTLYIIDMYRGVVQDDHFLTDELREQIFQRELETPVGMGRIWRIRHTGGKSDRTFPELADADDIALARALEHDNGWVRDTAQRMLLGRDGATAELKAYVSGENTVSALHAMWVLEGRGELEADVVLAAVRSGDPQRQIQALRAGRLTLDASNLVALAKELSDAPQAVRMQLLFTMGDHADSRIVRDALAQILSVAVESPYIRQAAARALVGQELQFLQEFLVAGHLEGQTDAGESLLSVLGAQAYRTLRPDLESTELANPALLNLLALAESRRGENAWEQIALMRGLASIVGETGFEPARLAEAPPVFSDGSVSEQDPLWNARLAGRASFTWPGDELAMGITPLSPEQLQLMALGEAFYPQCGACHGDDGTGTTGLAPALAGAEWVTGPPEWLGRIILQGMTGPVEVKGEIFDGVMPPHGHLAELDDATLAGLMTFMRRSWGNKEDPVSSDMVAAIRSESASRKGPWTATELQAVAFDRGFARFVGKFSVSVITITISEAPEGLHMSVPMYGSGVMEQISDTMFYGEAGSEKVKVEFIVSEDGLVNKMLLHRDGEKIPFKRKDG